VSSRLLTVLQTVAFPFRHVVRVGTPGENQTPDFDVRSVALYSLSYGGMEPTIGVEPMVCALRVPCFTAKLRRRGADDRIRTDLLLLTEEALVPTSITGVAPGHRFERR
jgi:hypothetical protein